MNENCTYFIEVSKLNGTDKRIKKFEDFDQILEFFYQLGKDSESHKYDYHWIVYEAEEII